MRAWIIAAAVVGIAITKSSNAGQAPAPKYGELPVGRVTAPPTDKDVKMPTAIAGTESVSGIQVRVGEARQMLYISNVSYGAGANNSVPQPPQTIEPGATCFALRQNAQLVGGEFGMLGLSSLQSDLSTMSPFGAPAIPRQEWEQSMTYQATLWSPNEKRMNVVHAERVVERGPDAVALESTDVWLDSTSRGTRLLSQASLPLKQIASVPGGVRIFAGRDDRADGKRLVQFIVVRAKGTPYQPAAAAFGSRSDGTFTSSGGCAHHRLSLQVTQAGGADTGTLQFTTVLPDLAPGEHSSATPLPNPGTTLNGKDVRTRPVRAHFSISQTSRDKEPAIAVSTSWAGPEVFQRIILPVPQMSVGFPSPPSPPAPKRATPLRKTKPTSTDPGF